MRSDALLELSMRVRRLSPDRRDPERFHADKDAIAKELARMAREAERQDERRTA